jgi:MFS family permease
MTRQSGWNVSTERAQVIGVGIAQLIAWASTTYLIALLTHPQAVSMGVSPSVVFAAFSFSLLLMGVLGPFIGRRIDRRGGRQVLMLSSLVIAAGLIVLGLAQHIAVLFAGWALLGVGMACGLYDSAFATLVRQHGLAARNSITGITLFGGFASTLGWPLTGWMVAEWGWRPACFVWAAINLGVALPLYRRFVPVPATTVSLLNREPRPTRAAGDRYTFWLLVVFGATTAFMTSALAAHLPGVLLALGLPLAAVLTAASVVGPAQVAGRLAEFAAARSGWLMPVRSGQLATVLHPLGVLLLLVGGGLPAALAFAALHGVGNGMLTIAKGTIPLQLFGPQGYGLIQGRLALAQRLTQAAAPLLFALLLESGGAQLALGVTAVLCIGGLCALSAIRPAPAV